MWERLRGDNEKDRLSALDELLVHDELAGSYRVEYEEGDGTCPEFRLYKHQDGAYVGTVEVVTLFLRKDWEAVERRNAVLQDALNARLRLTTHWIDFEVRRWDSNSPPKTGHMVKWIEDALSELRTDPSALPVDRFGRQEKVYSTRTVDIAFRFLPLSPTYVVDENARVVLGGAPISGFINSGTRLRERLDDKARKYDLHGKPFAVVVGVRDPVCDIGQVYEALVGTEEIVVPTLESRQPGMISRTSRAGVRAMVSSAYGVTAEKVNTSRCPPSSRCTSGTPVDRTAPVLLGSTTRWPQRRSPRMGCPTAGGGA
jgi:hypothetical protein